MAKGLIVRADFTGLGNQTRSLCYMLKPDKVLIIDSTPFTGNKQNFFWYDEFNTDKVLGFPDLSQLKQWFTGLTHVLTAETFYSDYAVNYAMRMGIKTYNQVNPEFYSHHVTPPTKFFMPSHWYMSEYEELYPGRVVFLPPPLYPNDFKAARKINFYRSGKRRFLAVVGKYASKDRNGTKSIIEALPYTKSDFELVIKSQHPLEFTVTDDPRITVEIGNVEDQQDLYKDFDALIYPRRYGGLALPANEALMSGLPVIMTDISPNDETLRKEWLVRSRVVDKLTTRIELDVYGADPKALAEKIDWLCETNLSPHKASALEIGMCYAADYLKKWYTEAMD